MIFIDEKIKLLEADLLRLVNQEFDHMIKLALTVKGIGNKIVISLIVTTDGFRLFDTAKHLAKFIGIASVHHQSGTSVKSNRGINPPLLDFCYLREPWSAIKHNKACKALYDRLRKAGYVALIAVYHKLIKQVFAVVKNEVIFDNEYEFADKKNS